MRFPCRNLDYRSSINRTILESSSGNEAFFVSDDVIVVGAGPAGATAARVLAERGHAVRLIDAQRFPRIKPCGGALTDRALGYLPQGYGDYIKTQGRRWTFKGRQLNAVTVERTRPYCHMVERQHFDQWLVHEAVRAGATFIDGQTVTTVDENTEQVVLRAGAQTYHASYLVAADGAKGVVARSLGWARPRHGAAIEVEVVVDQSTYRQWDERVEIDVSQFPWGYAWVIPRFPILNIGVGSFRAGGFPLKSSFLSYVAHVLGHPLDDNAKIMAHPLPYRWNLPRHFHTHRTVFVGDAAGLMDAFSAEGIYSALWSGTLAAQTIDNTIRHADSEGLSDYSLRVRREMWDNLGPAVRMGRLFYPLAGFWSNFFAQNQQLLHDYLDVAQGQKDYLTLLRHTEKALLSNVRLRGR